MSVRKVSNRGGNIIGKFPSIKMGRMIAFESLIERDFIYLLDYVEAVEWFEEQPLTIEYEYEGAKLHYTPDFHIIENGRNVLIECKPEKFVANAENQRKAGVARNWCAGRGWEYRVVSDREIRSGARLANVKLLTRYARDVVASGTRESIYELLRGGTAMTIAGLSGLVAPEKPTSVVGSILHLAFHHELGVPLADVPISGQTPVDLLVKTRREARV